MVQQEGQRLIEPINPIIKPNQRGRSIWKWAIAIAFATVGAVSLYSVSQSRSVPKAPAPAPVQENKPAIKAVAALGRLEPQGELTRVSAFNSLEGARVQTLLVKQGDRVQTGQILVVLNTYESRRAALLQAQTQVQVAQAGLEKVKAGAKVGDISAQQATIERLRAELGNAKLEYERSEALFQVGATSASSRDSKRLQVDTIQAQIDQASASLRSVAEVRPVDVKEAQAQVQNAIASVEAAAANLELAYVRSPIDGQVLKVHVRPGEIIGTDGIAEIGKTDRMRVVAQVYETDIGKIRKGQRVIATSDAFSGELQGIVDQIGLQVTQQNTFNNNPLAETDRKVIEVKALLNPKDSERVAGLTNLQVQVVFKR